MTDFIIAASETGYIHTDKSRSASETATVDLNNGRELHLRAAAKRIEDAARKAGMSHALLHDVFGIFVWNFTLNRKPPPETATLAHHWLTVMTTTERHRFVKELLEASTSPHRLRDVPVQLVSEGVSIVTQAAEQWVARHPKPAAVSRSLMIPEKDPDGQDTSNTDTNDA